MSKTKDAMERERVEEEQNFDDSGAPVGGYQYYDSVGKPHMHTFEGKPLIGASSPTKIIAKPLTWWASGKAVEVFGASDAKVITKIKNKKATKAEIAEMQESVSKQLERIQLMDSTEYYKLVDKAYRAHSVSLDKSADKGKDLHAELERFVKDEMRNEKRLPEAYEARILPYITWSRENVRRYLWSEVHCYSLKHWLGGISDAGILDNQGRQAVVDFKSTPVAYQTQFWQCAGYDIQFEENGGVDAMGRPVFTETFKADYYLVVPFGAESVRPYTNEEIGKQIGMDMSIEACRSGFLSALDLYKRIPRE